VTKAGGEALLDRSVALRVNGLTAPRYRLCHRRLDEAHSNLVAAWGDIGGTADWPDDGQWQQLAAGNRLEDLEPERVVEAVDGSLDQAFELPMPSVSLIELSPI